MKRRVLKVAVTMVTAGVMFITSQISAEAMAPYIEDVEHKGSGRIEVDFHGDVSYRNCKITVKDNKGKKYKVVRVRKDEDDIRFTIKKFKRGRTYKITIKGIRLWGTDGYGKRSCKVRIPKKARYVDYDDYDDDYYDDDDDDDDYYRASYYSNNPNPNPNPNPNSNSNINSDPNASNPTDPAGNTTPSQESSNNFKTEDEILQIALATISGATAQNTTLTKFELDYEHGVWVYEIEIRYGWMEYDMDVDAVTGQILGWEVDD